MVIGDQFQVIIPIGAPFTATSKGALLLGQCGLIPIKTPL